MKKKMIIVLASFVFLTKNVTNCMAGEYLQSMDAINAAAQIDINYGWVYHNNSWYYYDINGTMKTGWICPDSTTWYYLSNSGELLMDTITPDGYRVDKNGAWIPDARIYLGIDFSEEDIEAIDFYDIPVPAAAKMKHITKEKDIAFIYNIINNSIIVNEYKNHFPETGGITHLKFLKKDGSSIVLSICSSFIAYAQQKYVLKDTLMIEELWKSMEYDAFPVSQESYLQDLTMP